MAKNFSEIGINFNVFENVSFSEINGLTNQTQQEFIQSIPAVANTITGGYVGIIILLTMGVFLLWMLSDQTQFGLFRYSTLRALGISLGIIITFGINMIQIGYMTSFIQLNILVTFFILIFIYIFISNPS